MLDEWGYFESGHMGSTDLITPNIDQFASEGCVLPMLMQGLLSAAPPVARYLRDCMPETCRCELITGTLLFGQMNRLWKYAENKRICHGGFGKGNWWTGNNGRP